MPDEPWLNLHVRALWPHEESRYISGYKLRKALRMETHELVSLLEKKKFRSIVHPFYDPDYEENVDNHPEIVYDVDSVQFDPIEVCKALELYPQLFSTFVERMRRDAGATATPEKEMDRFDQEAAAESCPSLSSHDKWDLYLSAAKRLRGKVSDKQAHYWRCRAVARYLNEKEGVKAVDAFKRTEITMYACEKVAYNRSEVKSWIEESCPHPELFQKVKPWGEEPQMRPGSRLRETFQALGMVLVMSRPRPSEEDLIEECYEGDIRKYAEEETLDSDAAYWKYRKETKKEVEAKSKEDVAKQTKNKIKKWLKPLKPWFEESK